MLQNKFELLRCLHSILYGFQTGESQEVTHFRSSTYYSTWELSLTSQNKEWTIKLPTLPILPITTLYFRPESPGKWPTFSSHRGRTTAFRCRRPRSSTLCSTWERGSQNAQQSWRWRAEAGRDIPTGRPSSYTAPQASAGQVSHTGSEIKDSTVYMYISLSLSSQLILQHTSVLHTEKCIY